MDRIKGPWSPEEDEALQRLVQKHGARNWSLISKSIPGRSGKSCRLRWCNQLSPQVEHRPFTPDEDDAIVRAHRRFGNNASTCPPPPPRRPPDFGDDDEPPPPPPKRASSVGPAVSAGLCLSPGSPSGSDLSDSTYHTHPSAASPPRTTPASAAQHVYRPVPRTGGIVPLPPPPPPAPRSPSGATIPSPPSPSPSPGSISTPRRPTPASTAAAAAADGAVQRGVPGADAGDDPQRGAELHGRPRAPPPRRGGAVARERPQRRREPPRRRADRVALLGFFGCGS
uniref:Uncharacterized protein n=1 Tax=Ananas comosus var. bracteatus TaxID=296719 RepID=A0A6V7PLF5_ANACO|nr:unnamed protein product [Ananas comosus var. bracteatus]